MNHVSAWYICMAEEGIRFPGTEVTQGCELAHGCWHPNLHPLEEEPMLLTFTALCLYL